MMTRRRSRPSPQGRGGVGFDAGQASAGSGGLRWDLAAITGGRHGAACQQQPGSATCSVLRSAVSRVHGKSCFVECGTGQAGQVCRNGIVDPGGQKCAGPLGEHVADVADELVRGGQFGAAAQDRLELLVFVLRERGRAAGEPAGDLSGTRRCRGRLWGAAGLGQALTPG